MCDNKEKNIKEEELEKVNAGLDLGSLVGNSLNAVGAIATAVNEVPKGGDKVFK